MILICVNEIAGPTGYHKSVVELANGLHRAGHPVTMLSFFGTGDGSGRMLPTWPLDPQIPALTLQTLPAARGRLLHQNVHPVFTARLGALAVDFTANQLAALRQLNSTLTSEDTILFTAPVPANVFHHAVAGAERRAATVLQIHNDYLFHESLWDMLMDSRGSIDRLQTVSSGLRRQFVPVFAESDVVFVPNFPGGSAPLARRVGSDRVNIALPASFQQRKNQLDAIRALALIDDRSVHLTLWGGINRLNPYVIAVQQLIESLHLEDRVHLPGFGSEAEIYSTADIVVMTSLSEGLPFPLIEAASHGIPTVTYDFEFGPRDAVEDGGSGFIVPLGDVEQLAERLGALASDAELRQRFGERAAEIYRERFAEDHVAAQYREFLGETGHRVDIVDAFAVEGREPVAIDAIRHSVRRVRGRDIHEVVTSSAEQLHDVQLDNGSRIAAPRVRRSGTTTRLEFHVDGVEVISYTTSPGSGDRHYLADVSRDTFQVRPYLRRDADYDGGEPPVIDAVFATTTAARRPRLGELTAAFGLLARNAPRDVVWKLKQLSSSASSAASRTASLQAGAQAASGPDPHRMDQTVRLPAATLSSAARITATLGKRATNLMIARLGTNVPAPTRREIARHPWFPVTAGIDSFGTPINRRGGVAVRNTGSPLRPSVTVRGEYDWVLLRDGRGQRRVEPPFGYGELFERICTAEREHGLFDITAGDGVHVWELGRSALVLQLAEAFGLWGAANAVGTPVDDVYDGSKRLSSAPRSRKVVFDYIRRGQSDYRTAAYRDDGTLFVVQPEPGGYPEVDETNLVYPFHEFNRYRQDWRRRFAQLRAPEVDARPFEAALSEALGIRVDLGNHLRSRMLKFLDEREFFTPVFERVGPEEVMIASSHWWAGIAAAAARSGAVVSDIQYALTSRYAPSFWFGGAPHYGASRFYTWSEFWAERTNVYQEHVVVPRQQPEFAAAIDRGPREPVWDVCVISQPRVLRRILAFVQDLVRERPDLTVVIAPHPAQRPLMAGELAAAGLTGKVTIAPDDTLSTIALSEVCVGTFSTSLWEAVALGRPTYVIPVPGYEETLQDIESGLFRLANSPHDLIPYELPETRHMIFGHGG